MLRVNDIELQNKRCCQERVVDSKKANNNVKT